MRRLGVIGPAVLALAVMSIGGCAAGSPGGADQAEFVAMFDGQTLDGWYKVGGNAEYHIEDAQIVGVCDNSKPNTFLRTRRTYGDFEFRCEFRWDIVGNSGIQFRSQQRETDSGQADGRVFGYQCELDNRLDRRWSGGVYEEGRRGWLYGLEGDEHAAKRQAMRYDDWNEIVIRCEGQRMQTWINGVAITDHTDETQESLSQGFIALQVHAGEQGTMRWRNLRILELAPTDAAGQNQP